VRDQHPDGSQTARLLNPYVLCQRWRGRYDVAWTAPSWSSLIGLDIDRPAPAADAELEQVVAANAARDEVLAAWRAFGGHAARRPLAGGAEHTRRRRSPRLPGEPPPGSAPSSGRGPTPGSERGSITGSTKPGWLGSPGVWSCIHRAFGCGRPAAAGWRCSSHAADDPGDMRLEEVHARWVDPIDGRTGERTRVLRRSLFPRTLAFLRAIDGQRRPVKEWCGGEVSTWHGTRPK
jgi:hypothetical protein